MKNKNDIICALSTPEGMGALGVIRLSGEGSIALTNNFFNKNLLEAPTHSLRFGEIHSDNEIIDEVLISVFRKNKSFTGEESIEISGPMLGDEAAAPAHSRLARLKNHAQPLHRTSLICW